VALAEASLQLDPKRPRQPGPSDLPAREGGWRPTALAPTHGGRGRLLAPPPSHHTCAPTSLDSKRARASPRRAKASRQACARRASRPGTLQQPDKLAHGTPTRLFSAPLRRPPRHLIETNVRQPLLRTSLMRDARPASASSSPPPPDRGGGGTCGQRVSQRLAPPHTLRPYLRLVAPRWQEGCAPANASRSFDSGTLHSRRIHTSMPRTVAARQPLPRAPPTPGPSVPWCLLQRGNGFTEARTHRRSLASGKGEALPPTGRALPLPASTPAPRERLTDVLQPPRMKITL